MDIVQLHLQLFLIGWLYLMLLDTIDYGPLSLSLYILNGFRSRLSLTYLFICLLQWLTGTATWRSGISSSGWGHLYPRSIFTKSYVYCVLLRNGWYGMYWLGEARGDGGVMMFWVCTFTALCLTQTYPLANEKHILLQGTSQ